MFFVRKTGLAGCFIIARTIGATILKTGKKTKQYKKNNQYSMALYEFFVPINDLLFLTVIVLLLNIVINRSSLKSNNKCKSEVVLKMSIVQDTTR